MMTKFPKIAALALAASGLTLATPASAGIFADRSGASAQGAVYGDMSYDHGRKHRKDWSRGNDYYGERAAYTNYDRDRDYNYDRYDQRVDRDTRVWRGDDGRYYCRKQNGTTGLLIGAGVGGVLGHEIAGRNGDRTLGAILGAAGGALLGREIDRSGSRCR